ncbi:MAG TPA: TMEM175 family protein [Trebonia sp.]|nr:TMEM175 family protein [Trebonia sp.]
MQEAAGNGDPEAAEEEREAQARAIDRLTLFSDAVVAIAITLLALELPVPTGKTVAAFWASVIANDEHYVAFLISFLVIAAAWGNHHDLFRYARRGDSRLRTLNMAWLLTIVLIPFATKMLTSTAGSSLEVHALRFGFYALLQVVQAGLLLAMVSRVGVRDRTGGASGPWGTRYVRRTIAVMAGFGLSIPLFFVAAQAWLLWFLVPLLAAPAARLFRAVAAARR